MRLNMTTSIRCNLKTLWKQKKFQGFISAAAQGLWAGVNAACKVQKRPAFVLDRSQAYLGVLIDDLVTRGTLEPYRMFTSRAEYRLMLREDNADLRLMEIGHDLGLISEATIREVRERKAQIQSEIERIKHTVVKPTQEVNAYLNAKGTNPIQNGVFLDQLLKRAELGYGMVNALSPTPESISDRTARQVEIEIKYEGYIKRQLSEIEKFKHLELIKLPEELDFNAVHGLSNELKQKLTAVKPVSLGQASRIQGMTPAAISVIMIALKALERKRSENN
jgi:tRNA uridine 5-carboxymethylaminomethyl modification enzyme